MNFKERLKIALQRPTEFESGGYIKNAGGGDSIVYGARHSQGGVALNKNTELEGGGFTTSGTPKAGEVITTVYDAGGNPNQFFMSHKNGIAQRYLAEKAANGGILPQQRKQDYARMNERANPDGNVQDIAANGGMGGCKECEENKYKYGGKPNQYFMGGALTTGGLSGRDIDWTSGALNRKQGYVEHEPRGLENGGMNYYDEGGKTIPLKLSMGMEGNTNCGPGLKKCRDTEGPVTLQSYTGFEYDLANKLAGARANLGTQFSFGPYDTRSGAPVLQTGVSGSGSLNLDNVTNPNPDQNALKLGLDAYAKLGYKKKGSSSSAKGYSSPTVEAGVEGSYDFLNKNINNVGVYGRYGSLTGSAGYNPQTKTPTLGVGLKFDDGGVRRYNHGGPHSNMTMAELSALTNQIQTNPTTETPKNKTSKTNPTSKTNTQNPYDLGWDNNSVSTIQSPYYYNANGSGMTKAEVQKKNKDKEGWGLSNPVFVADVVGATGIPVVSEVGDLTSAAISTAKGDYTSAGLSLAGLAIPFAGGAALKTGGKAIFDKAKKVLNPISNWTPTGATKTTLEQSFKIDPKTNTYIRDANGKPIKTIEMLKYTNQTVKERALAYAKNGWELAKTAGVYTGIYQGVKYVFSDDMTTATNENGEKFKLGNIDALRTTTDTTQSTDTIPSIVTPSTDTTSTNADTTKTNNTIKTNSNKTKPTNGYKFRSIGAEGDSIQ